MSVGYVLEVKALYNDDDAFRVYGVTGITLAGTTLTLTTTSYAGVGHTTVSMLSASEIRLYKGTTWLVEPPPGYVSTHTGGSATFDALTTSYTYNGSGVSSI